MKSTYLAVPLWKKTLLVTNTLSVDSQTNNIKSIVNGQSEWSLIYDKIFESTGDRNRDLWITFLLVGWSTCNHWAHQADIQSAVILLQYRNKTFFSCKFCWMSYLELYVFQCKLVERLLIAKRFEVSL